MSERSTDEKFNAGMWLVVCASRLTSAHCPPTASPPLSSILLCLGLLLVIVSACSPYLPTSFNPVLVLLTLSRNRSRVLDCVTKQCRALQSSGWEKNADAIAKLAAASDKLVELYLQASRFDVPFCHWKGGRASWSVFACLRSSRRKR